MHFRGGGVGHSIRRRPESAYRVAPDLFQRAGYQPAIDLQSEVPDLPIIQEEEEEEENMLRELRCQRTLIDEIEEEYADLGINEDGPEPGISPDDTPRESSSRAADIGTSYRPSTTPAAHRD